MADTDVALARQPILAANGSLYAYELLHRANPRDVAGDAATRSARVVCETLGAIGLDRLAGDARVFLKFDQQLLEADLPTLLIPDRSVVEILETVVPRPNVFATLEKMRQLGIGIAIDEFLFQSNLVPFLAHADYVKVDIEAAADDLESIVRRLAEYRLKLLAQKVETHEQFARCKELGFQYFQGQFFACPEPISKRSLAPLELSVLTVVARLQNPDVGSMELADAIGIDVALAHQLLTIANSGALYRGRAVTSILEAVVMLGHNVIRQWASLLLLSRQGLNKPSELLKVAVTRARLCQTLGKSHRDLSPHELFTTGLLSVLDALLDCPMDIVLADLPLAPSLKDALCGRPSGTLGAILRRAIDYGSGAWVEESATGPSGEGFSLETYLDAVEFADRALSA